MKIYLKGYYGYQNFWDEVLLFGVVEEIFARYKVQKLVIEVGNKAWIEKWTRRNLPFIEQYYQARGSKVDRKKVVFFQPYATKRGKISHYLARFFGQDPYRSYFKIFWGGEVLDESRSFPHNGWNLLLLYWKDIFSANFSIWGGLGSQKYKSSQILQQILLTRAKNPLLRDSHSFQLAKKWQHNAELFQDFSLHLLAFFWKKDERKTKQKDNYCLLNISPQGTKKQEKKLLAQIQYEEYYQLFPCDLSLDIPLLQKRENETKNPCTWYFWNEHSLEEIFLFIKEAHLCLASRLHLLYCCEQLKTPFKILVKNSKIKNNLQWAKNNNDKKKLAKN